jgi:hypothetical protein
MASQEFCSHLEDVHPFRAFPHRALGAVPFIAFLQAPV